MNFPRFSGNDDFHLFKNNGGTDYKPTRQQEHVWCNVRCSPACTVPIEQQTDPRTTLEVSDDA